jgi:glutathione peroxidase
MRMQNPPSPSDVRAELLVAAQNRNYNSLRALYTKYHAQGFNLIAFPCNQFGSQAPESSDGERKIAIDKFGFEFPIMVSR